MRRLSLVALSLAAATLSAADAAPRGKSPKPAVKVAAVANAKTVAPVAAAVPPSAAFAGETDAAVVERVFGYLEGLTTLQGGFTQIAPNGTATDGVFYLKRPGLLRFDYAPPSPLKIVANGGLVYVRDDKLQTTDSYPLGETPLKFLLKKRVEMKDIRVASVERTAEQVAVAFSSVDAKVEGQLVAVFAAPTLALKQWAIHDAQGGVTVVNLRDVVSGKDIPNRTFATPETRSPFLKNQ